MSRNCPEILSRADYDVTPRKRRVSRNLKVTGNVIPMVVTPRKRRVSRNPHLLLVLVMIDVTPRKRRVSRNIDVKRY